MELPPRFTGHRTQRPRLGATPPQPEGDPAPTAGPFNPRALRLDLESSWPALALPLACSSGASLAWSPRAARCSACGPPMAPTWLKGWVSRGAAPRRRVQDALIGLMGAEAEAMKSRAWRSRIHTRPV